MRFFKRSILFVLVMAVALSAFNAFLFSSASVTQKECRDAYNFCQFYYQLSGPMGQAYCFNGYVFCMLFCT